MARDEDIQWQPIRALPMIANLIREALADSQGQYEMLKEAETKPHVLDDATVDRVLQCYREQTEFVGIYQEQLVRWKKGTLTAAQRQKIAPLTLEVERLGQVGAEILGLARRLKEGTIERVLEKSDFELGLDFFLGKQERP